MAKQRATKSKSQKQQATKSKSHNSKKSESAPNKFIPVEIFVSYSHKDAEALNTLINQLVVWERENYIKIWRDKRIPPGSDFEEEIYAHLQSSNIILLLISPNYYASDYCIDNELVWALKRKADDKVPVITIMLKKMVASHSKLKGLQALPQPPPITHGKWKRSDHAWANVAHNLKYVIEIKGNFVLPAIE